jgi:integral membrane sensor domain MASE1
MNQEITIPTRDISRKIFWDRQVLLILEILLLAISYFGLAKLSLATAATPTLSAIWTPSGLAVAALMVRGFRIWPGWHYVLKS